MQTSDGDTEEQQCGDESVAIHDAEMQRTGGIATVASVATIANVASIANGANIVGMLGPLEGLADMTGLRYSNKAIPLCPVAKEQYPQLLPSL